MSDDMTVSDARFSTLHNDPRFMRFPSAEKKVKIDKRFEKMFSDPNFSTGAKGGKTDKRGRRTVKAKKTAADDLKEYYQLDEDGEDGDGGEGGGGVGGDGDERFAKRGSFAAAAAADDDGESEEEEEEEESDDDDEEEEEESEKAKIAREKDELEARLEISRDKMRGVGNDESSSEEEDDDDEMDEDEDDDGEKDDDDEEGVIPRMLAGGKDPGKEEKWGGRGEREEGHPWGASIDTRDM